MSSWANSTPFQRMTAVNHLYAAVPGTQPLTGIDYSAAREPLFQTPMGKIVNIDGQILKGGRK